MSKLPDHLHLQFLASEHLTGLDARVLYVPGTGYVVCRDCARQTSKIHPNLGFHPVSEIPPYYVCCGDCNRSIWDIYVPAKETLSPES